MTKQRAKQAIEKIDAAAIAEHILDRLSYRYRPLATSKLFPRDRIRERTIVKIEELEKSWQLKLKDQRFTYGRKHRGEPIRLWSIPSKSALVLQALVALTKAKTIVEIGTSAGYAALHLSAGARANRGTVYTIELLKEKISLAKRYFRDAEATNIKLLRADARRILKGWRFGKIDFVFLDADKENYGAYLDLLLPRMKKDGLIVADNVNDYGHMMQDYLQRVTGTHFAGSRVDKRVTSYYLAALDNGLIITKKLVA